MHRHGLHPKRLAAIMAYSNEPDLPVPMADLPTIDMIPVCPVCGGMMRRRVGEPPSERSCDLHGKVTPRWAKYPKTAIRR